MTNKEIREFFGSASPEQALRVEALAAGIASEDLAATNRPEYQRMIARSALCEAIRAFTAVRDAVKDAFANE